MEISLFRNLIAQKRPEGNVVQGGPQLTPRDWLRMSNFVEALEDPSE